MPIELSIEELPSPKLQFGGAVQEINPKLGLEAAGPFDLRFCGARKNSISVGIVAPESMVSQANRWLERCRAEIPYPGPPSLLHRSFPSFKSVFHKTLEFGESTTVTINDEELAILADAMSGKHKYETFQQIVDAYAAGLESLAKRDANRPDVILICLPQCIVAKAKSVERQLSLDERRAASAIAENALERQLDLFDINEEVEQTSEDLLKRDFRLALKARALRVRLPVQLATLALFEDSERRQDPATRAWNFCVGIYYKSGGVPWRLPITGPETCYVGVSFHHFRTSKRHLVHSSLAQAFSSEGEGFALRGEGVPSNPEQGRNTKLSGQQAESLGRKVLAEYMERTGSAPLRMVVHKTSQFDDAEIEGFNDAFRDIPVVSMVTLIPSPFRLLRFGQYPVTIGTVCTVNAHRTYLYTTGFMPSLGTYPGPHIPEPFEIRSFGDDEPEDAVKEIFALSRMNWNTADVRGKWPVTLSYARRVGGVLDEYGDDQPSESSLRYFM
jgi:hypothetical protein